jgi:hypothetical protein
MVSLSRGCFRQCTPDRKACLHESCIARTWILLYITCMSWRGAGDLSPGEHDLTACLEKDLTASKSPLLPFQLKDSVFRCFATRTTKTIEIV